MCENFGNFKLIEPFYPNPLDKNSLKEIFNEDEIYENIIFIEPILFNEHITILLFSFKNNNRINLLIDPSLYHFNSIAKDRVIFPPSMKNAFIYPYCKVQSGPSCSIWFVAQMLVLFEKKIDSLNETLESDTNLICTV